MSRSVPDEKKGKVALVTGGAGNLGRRVVERLLADDIRVHVPTFDEREAERLRDALGAGGGAEDASRVGEDASRVGIVSGVDLAKPEAVDRVIVAIAEAEGRGPDILLNLAGGFATSAIEETEPAAWEKMWRMNATTAFLCSRAVFPGMKERGWGRIVNVSAFPAIDRGRAGLSAYGAAKAAVLNLTHTLAREGAPHGITVNAVLPSIIDTPENRAAMPSADTSTWLPPEEIAEVIAFLVSDRARIVNGAAVPLTLSE